MAGSLDLSTLPAPEVIEELDNEAIIARQKQAFQELWDAVRAANPDLDLPEYDVINLETDPVVIGIEAESYRELLMRSRINEAARANLLAFAKRGDLEHLAAFYDVVRMTGEDDDRLKTRVVLAIQGRSTGGTEARYKFIAMSADIRVKDAIIYTVGRSPLIRVAIFSTDADGVAQPELLAIVNTALQNPAVKMVNDTIVVASAVQQVINIVADAWLLPDADDATLTRAATNLRNAWASARALGRDFNVSWWTAQLMIASIQKIAAVSPAGDIVVDPASSISLGTITINNKGRAF